MAIAAVISQLKWLHFRDSRNPQQLYDLHRYDQASRGPWGSLLLLTHWDTLNEASVSMKRAISFVDDSNCKSEAPLPTGPRKETK
ncbi:MAG: hypothetical protein Q9195_007297 [Heterodermia aff. obscurata]